MGREMSGTPKLRRADTCACALVQVTEERSNGKYIPSLPRGYYAPFGSGGGVGDRPADHNLCRALASTTTS